MVVNIIGKSTVRNRAEGSVVVEEARTMEAAPQQ